MTASVESSSSTGAIQGVVKANTGDTLEGVTVILTSPVLAQAQTAITDAHGSYKIFDLPPGDYVVTFFYVDMTVERPGVQVVAGKVSPAFQTVDHPPLVAPPDLSPTIERIPLARPGS